MIQIIHADCLDAMRGMADESVDSVVTDPPYHLHSRELGSNFGTLGAHQNSRPNGQKGNPASRGFMGKQWDGGDIAFRVELWAEVFRVLKPGGHLVSFGGTRTYHRMACAIEDAGFEIRDQLSWIYGSGFPKSQNVGKAFDKAAGAEREVVIERTLNNNRFAVSGDGKAQEQFRKFEGNANITSPATDLAKQWDGWGTALKPAHEPICLARKPLIGTVAQNVAAHGTGAINIDGCRVDGVKNRPVNERVAGKAQSDNGWGTRSVARPPGYEHEGRWPANVVTDGSEEVLEAFARFEGGRRAGERPAKRSGLGYMGNGAGTTGTREVLDTGTAARFFFSAKASRKERDSGLEGLSESNPFDFERMGSKSGARRNAHPTVKPIALMQWLVRLVTPPGGIVLDPFLGSGSTAIAADREGFSCIGIELEAEYVEIARRRVQSDAPLLTEMSP